MAYAPPLGAILAMTVYCQETDQVSINTVYGQVTGVSTGGATLNEIAVDYAAGLAGALKALLANTASFRGVGVRDISTLPKQAASYSASGAGVGSAGAVCLPRQTAGLISVYDGLAGKGHRGRFYVPFPSATDNMTDGVPTVGYLARLVTLAPTLFTLFVVVGAGGSTSVTPGLVHRFVNKVKLPNPTITFPLVAPVPRSVWATQRRRGSYGRPNKSPV